MRWRDALLPGLVLAMAGCGPTPGDPVPAPRTDSAFEQVVVPILNRHCVMCHMADGAQGELSLHPQPHAAMVGVPSTQSQLLLVAPGDVAGSYLYHKLVGSHMSVGGTGASMPYQRELLEASDIKAIEQWIADGARGG